MFMTWHFYKMKCVQYIDNVLSLNDGEFDIYVHMIFSPKLEINNTTDNSCSASYIQFRFDNTGTEPPP